MPELRHYNYFIAVAETKNFHRAAERCCLSQSAISQQIGIMEKELGEKLFNRSHNNITLTEAGEELLPLARKVIQDANACIDRIGELRGLMCGELRIGVGNFIEPYIRKAVIRMHEQYPHVRFNVTFAKASALNKMLCDHDIDLAFTMNKAYCSENIISTECISFNLRAIMSKTHVLASKAIITYDDILKHNVLLPDCGLRVFESVGKFMPKEFDLTKLKIVAVVNNPDAICKALGDMNCITFMPALNVDIREGLVAKPIEGIEKKLVSNVHRLKSEPLKKSAEIFLNTINDFCIPYFENLEV